MIDIKNIDFSYPGQHEKVFDDFSLELSENKIYGLLGKNGTGKSTLLYLISGLLKAQKGTIKMDGCDSFKRLPSMLEKMFLVPEEHDLPSMSFKDYVAYNSMFYPSFSHEVLKQSMADFELPDSFHLGSLSMGQKKKAFICFALATQTPLLLMDEPTNGLDIPSKVQFRKAVANNMRDDRTLIISTHQVHDVGSLLDHILILSQRKMLLNSSMGELTDKYNFSFIQPGDDTSKVLYFEPSMQGQAVIKERQKDDPETRVNLELLFNAVIMGKIQ